MTDSTDEILLDILDVLIDIRQALAPQQITLSGEALGVSKIWDATYAGDGGLTVPRSEIRTYGDATVTPILSGDEEGLA